MSSGETWVLNNIPTMSATFYDFDVLYVSNNESFKGFAAIVESSRKFINYYSEDSASSIVVAYSTNQSPNWKNNAYRTLTFATAPTGDLLTWLQSNGTKQ